LVPNPRQVTARTPAEVLELAVALRKENPARTAASVRRILRAQLGWSPDEHTLARYFTRLGLSASSTQIFMGLMERPRVDETGCVLR